jgi:hypothetical protein
MRQRRLKPVVVVTAGKHIPEVVFNIHQNKKKENNI